MRLTHQRHRPIPGGQIPHPRRAPTSAAWPAPRTPGTNRSMPWSGSRTPARRRVRYRQHGHAASLSITVALLLSIWGLSFVSVAPQIMRPRPVPDSGQPSCVDRRYHDSLKANIAAFTATLEIWRNRRQRWLSVVDAPASESGCLIHLSVGLIAAQRADMVAIPRHRAFQPLLQADLRRPPACARFWRRRQHLRGCHRNVVSHSVLPV